jgi:hypothetical protein
MGHSWTIEELTKLAGGNLLRVMQEVHYLNNKKNNNKKYQK